MQKIPLLHLVIMRENDRNDICHVGIMICDCEISGENQTKCKK